MHSFVRLWNMISLIACVYSSKYFYFVTECEQTSQHVNSLRIIGCWNRSHRNPPKLMMFPNATVSSRSSSSRSGSCGRNSSMPSLRMQSPLAPRTSINPLFRHSDAQFTSFDASHFMFRQQKMVDRRKSHLRRYHSHDSQANFGESSGDSKDNSPDSTQDRVGSRSAPDSAAGSSPESTGDRGKRQEYEVKDFLDRYSLPRVVRVTGGEPLLLYRCFDNFTKVQARAIAGRKGKEKTESQILHFPEGYPGKYYYCSLSIKITFKL